MKPGKKQEDAALCPCGADSAYEACCQRLHEGLPAQSPEALMRSRYAAYVLKLEPYLLETWHSQSRPGSLELQQDQSQWLGLKVIRAPAAQGDEGLVEFLARYKVNGRAYRLHEVSRFLFEGGRWFYVDGVFPEE